MTLGIIVITNKKQLPEKIIKNLKFSDELLVYHTLETDDFATKRNKALSKINTDWVLFVDDDEIVSADLAAEIRSSINSKDISGFFLKRHDVCFYQEMKWGEIKDQKILRLARKGTGIFTRSVHETWQVSGQKKILNNPLFHQKDFFISQFLMRIRSYGSQDAREQTKEGKKFSILKLLLLPKIKFFVNYIIKQGFRDGYPGLFLSYLMSVQSFSVRVYQWEQKLQK